MKAMRYKTWAGARGVLAYNEKGQLIGGNMMENKTREMGREFHEIASQRPDIAKPVFHTALSLTPGENVSDEKARQLCEAHLKNIGVKTDNHQYAVYRHDDNGLNHFHIVLNRVGYNGKIFLAQEANKLAIDSTQKLEVKFGLTRTPGLEGGKQKSVRLTKSEKDHAKRFDVEHPKITLARQINSAIEKSGGSLKVFTHECEQNGVKVKLNMANTGKVNGVRFELENNPAGFDVHTYKGSDLAKGYAWKGLSQRLEHQAEKIRTPERQPKEKSREIDFDLKPKTNAREKDKGLGEVAEIMKPLSKQEKERAAILEADHAVRTSMLAKIDRAFKVSMSDKGNLVTFSEQLKKDGVNVELNTSTDGKVNGGRFSLANHPEGLGESYTWKELNDRLAKATKLQKPMESVSDKVNEAVKGIYGDQKPQPKEKPREVDFDLKPKAKTIERDKDKGWER